VASIKAYRILTHLGFENVRRFAGGIDEWEEAGYPLEGDSVKSSE
jgi:rhodanese-related sulfurtransferase